MGNSDEISLGLRLPDTVSVAEARDVFSQVMNFFHECEITKRESARHSVAVEILSTEINRKYDLWGKVFTEIFSERRAGILKTFEVIDKGIANNDKQMINMGLMGLSSIVASSPFADIEMVVDTICLGQQISI
jgi:hypothetical protein